MKIWIVLAICIQAIYACMGIICVVTNNKIIPDEKIGVVFGSVLVGTIIGWMAPVLMVYGSVSAIITKRRVIEFCVIYALISMMLAIVSFPWAMISLFPIIGIMRLYYRINTK